MSLGRDYDDWALEGALVTCPEHGCSYRQAYSCPKCQEAVVELEEEDYYNKPDFLLDATEPAGLPDQIRILANAARAEGMTEAADLLEGVLTEASVSRRIFSPEDEEAVDETWKNYVADIRRGIVENLRRKP